MKIILNFFRVLISIVLTLVLTVSLLVTCIVRPIMQTINGTDNGGLVNTVVEGMVDEIISNEDSEGAKAIFGMIEEKTGLKSEQFKAVLQNEEIRSLAEDVLNAAISNAIGNGNVTYPDKETVTDTICNNLDDFAAVMGKEGLASVDKETVSKFVDEQYDNVLNMMKGIVSSYIGESEGE